MKKLISFLFIIISLSMLTSCSKDDMTDELVPKAEARFAEEYLNNLRVKDFAYVKSQMSKEVLAQANDEILLELSNYFRKGELLSTEIIDHQVKVQNGKWQGNFSFEYQFSDGWNIANVALIKVNEKYEVAGLNVYQTILSQKELRTFTFKNKSILQYLVLLLSIIIPVFIIITAYYCARTPMPKRKWLWLLFVLLGISTVQINWATGDIGYQLLSAHLLGISFASSSPYAPYVISASFPLGAIIFWFRKRFIKLN